MAYAPTPEDQNAPQQLQGQNMNQIATSSGVGANSSASGSPQGSTAVPATTQAPPVQNLQAYLQANAPQAVQMGQNIANNLSQTAGKVTGDINAAQTDLGNQIQAQNVAPNQDLINRAAESPDQFVNNAQDVTAFQQQRDANYGGPTSFESTPYSQTLTTEVQNAVNSAPDITQPSGLSQLARGQEKNPTTGMSNLDALLLEENPNAVAPIQGEIPKFAQLPGQLGNAQTSTNKSIQDAIKNDQASKAAVQDRFFTGQNAAVPGWQQTLADEVTAAQGKANTYNQSVQDVIDKENAMKSLLSDTQGAISGYNNQNYNPAQLNLSPDSKLVQMGYDLSGLSKAPTALGAATPGAVASSKDYAIEAALNQLLGINLTNLNPADASKAGSYSVPQNASLDTKGAIEGLQNELNASKQGFTNNGGLQWKGTPGNSIVTNKDIPSGYVVVPQSDLMIPGPGHVPQLGHVKGEMPQYNQNGEQYVAVPAGSVLPDGRSVGSNPVSGSGHQGQTNVTGLNTPDTGGTFVGQAGGHGSTPSIGAPQYYSNQPLNSAESEISQLIQYLQGIS